MPHPRTVIKNVQVVQGSPGTENGKHDIYLSNGRIEAIRPTGTRGAKENSDAVVIDGTGLTAAPGFIDLHIHGGRGADVLDATEEAFATVGQYHATGGTTAYLVTTVTEKLETTLRCVDMAARAREQRIGGVEVLGVHLEGPYINLAQRGCHEAGLVRPPSREENRVYLDRAHIIRRVTLAPEIPGTLDFISDLSRQGIIASGGHSMATLEETQTAAEKGLSMITHLYCSMASITRKGPFKGPPFMQPGMVESALFDDRLAAEIILDLKHVPPQMVLLALKAKAEDAVCFITDATRGAGMPDGRYKVGPIEVVVEKGYAIQADGTGLAGSVAQMIDLVRNGVEGLGLSLASSVRRASLIPAKLIGVADRKGTLEVGKDADIVLLETTPRLKVRRTLARGETIAVMNN